MGYIINEKTFINENIFKFEKRLESQYSLFLEKNPTFVTYYHINNVNSITDTGLLNIESILGRNSPLRFQRIADLPIYGLDYIKLDLSDEEEGLNSSFEGDAIILPNTIKPVPNDFFSITYLDKRYLFMITQIDYDTIKSNNFYKINFFIRSLDDENYQYLESQVLSRYDCIFKNIGTDDKCIILEDSHKIIDKIESVYTQLVQKYITLFYSKKFNSLVMVDANGMITYDKFLTHFINSNQLLNKREEYNTITLFNEDYGDMFPIAYQESIFTAIEENDMSSLDYVRYALTGVTYPQSIFKYYSMNNVRSVVMVDVGNNEYIPNNLIDQIRYDIISNDMSYFHELMVKYFNNNLNSIYALSIERIDKYKMKYTMSDFIFVPICLYILRNCVTTFMTQNPAGPADEKTLNTEVTIISGGDADLDPNT